MEQGIATYEIMEEEKGRLVVYVCVSVWVSAHVCMQHATC